jgi:uncharacterized protein YbbK (DUF523 family)
LRPPKVKNFFFSPYGTGMAVVSGKLRLGISACLLGRAVRYDGGHKLDRWLRDVLGERVEYVPLCPEIGCGLSVPREPMRLEGAPGRPRLVTLGTRLDITDRMRRWLSLCLEGIEGLALAGCILKARSPSCALSDAEIVGPGGSPRMFGAGLFAAALAARFPGLPVTDENSLRDAGRRHEFLERAGIAL